MTKPTIYTVDRSTLNLPETLECSQCHEVKESTLFDFKPRNQYTKDSPYELKSECKTCSKTGSMMERLQANEKVISDALITELTANNGHHLQQVVQCLIQATIANPTADMLRLLIITAQGGNPIVHVNTKLPEAKGTDAPPVQKDSATTLLSSLKLKANT